MEEYLVFQKDNIESVESFLIVQAKNNEEAIRKYARTVGIRNSFFRQYVYDQTVNGSFACIFFYDNTDPLLSEENGEWLYPEEVAKKKFIDRVLDYFSEKPAFAQRYLDFFYDRDVETINELEAKWAFPEDMLVMMWYEDYKQEVVAIPINRIPRCTV